MPSCPKGKDKKEDAMFVAINTISCREEYRERFEQMFSTRAHAIDTMPGFQQMEVLKPNKPDGNYLVISHWDSEADFKAWVGSPQFHEGHKRAFADLKSAEEAGQPRPMHSEFRTYEVLCK